MRKKNQVFLSGEVKTAKHDLVYSFRRLSNVHSGQAKDVVFYPVYHSRACKTRTSKWTSRTSADQTSNVGYSNITRRNWTALSGTYISFSFGCLVFRLFVCILPVPTHYLNCSMCKTLDWIVAAVNSIT